MSHTSSTLFPTFLLRTRHQHTHKKSACHLLAAFTPAFQPHQQPDTVFLTLQLLLSACCTSSWHGSGVCYLSTNNRPLSVLLTLPSSTYPFLFFLLSLHDFRETLEPTDSASPLTPLSFLMDDRGGFVFLIFFLTALASSHFRPPFPGSLPLCFVWLITAPLLLSLCCSV